MKGLLATSGGHMREMTSGFRYSRANGSRRLGSRIGSMICEIRVWHESGKDHI